jgi:predicted ATPase/DNA-binding SARP family transcriptional activator
MAMQTLKLLGPVQVKWDTGNTPRFRSQRTMALLGYLAAERRAVARKTLDALFWPDDTAATGQANLRRELHNLGRILPGCWQVNSTAVQFAPGADTQVDIYELRHLIENKQWLEATTWLGGEFLEGIFLEDNPEFESWLRGEQERRRQTAERVLMGAARGEIERGDTTAARRYLGRLLRFAPWHEEAHRHMMRLLAQSGRIGDALKQYEQCRAVLATELDVAPSPATKALYERIKTAQAMPTLNLPPPATPMIGREAESAALQRLLADPNCRLLTLTGMGGIGKSRLALQIARLTVADDFRLFLHGVAFAPLVGVDRQDLLPTIAAALGLAFSGPEPAEHQLLRYLRDMEMLLLLDNYEHLLPDTELLATILREAPAVKLLVTSRERIKLLEEWVFELDGLPYPEEATDSLEVSGEPDYAAVRLFVSCARRGQRSFSLAQSGREVASICRMVQGLPLALELSAARLQLLTPAAVLVELRRGIDSNLDVFTADAGNTSPRHASLRTVFDASWAGLTIAEQRVLSRLSLFRGGFTRPAAAAVAEASPPVLGLLTGKSLIRLLPSGRYEMHELLRQYAAARLAADPGLDEAAQEGYAAYYGGFLQHRERRLLETDQEETLSEMTPEMDNVRLAWRWLVQRERLEVLDEAFWTLAFYYQLRGQILDGLTLAEEALAGITWPDEPEPQTARLHVRIQLFRAMFIMFRGGLAKSRDLMEQMLPQLRIWGTPQDVSWGLWVLGQNSGWIGDQSWVSNFREGLAIARASGFRWMESFLAARLADFLFYYIQDPLTLAEECDELLSGSMIAAKALDNPFLLITVFLAKGDLEKLQGDYQRAENSYKQALAETQRINHLWLMSMANRDLGHTNYLMGKIGQARQYYEEMRLLVRRIGASSMEANLLQFMGNLARAEGEFDQALDHFQASLDLMEETGATAELVLTYSCIGHVLLANHKVERAVIYFHKCLLGISNNSDPNLAAMVLAGSSGVLAARGQARDAARLAGAAQARFLTIPRRLDPIDLKDWERIQSEARGQLDGDSFTLAWAEGQAMPVDKALELALSLIH